MRRAATATALIVALGIGTGTASAGSAQYPTVFTKFKYKGGELFSGKIGSTKGGCIDGRKVILYRKKSGDEQKLGKDNTDGNGKFKIELSGGPPKDGKYYALVKQNKLGNGSVCLERQSGYVKVEIS